MLVSPQREDAGGLCKEYQQEHPGKYGKWGIEQRLTKGNGPQRGIKRVAPSEHQ